MEQELITSQVTRTVSIGLSIVCCSPLMSTSTCRDLLFRKTVQQLLLPALNKQTMMKEVNQMIDHFEQMQKNTVPVEILLQEFKSCLCK